MKNKIISEQILNDGSYSLPKLLADTNDRLKSIGKRGKTATIKVSGQNLAAQFNYEKQQQKGLNLRYNQKGLEEAERYCRLITSHLLANTFTWDWFEGLIGKKQVVKTEKVTGAIAIATYKNFYLKENAGLRYPMQSYYRSYRHIETVLSSFESQITVTQIKSIIHLTENNSYNRTYCLNGLINFLDYFQINEFDSLIARYRKNNNPKPKTKYIPSDIEIVNIWENKLTKYRLKKGKNAMRCKQWVFIYCLLAVYGLRVHEVWNIANWDTSVIFKNGDWLAIGDDELEIDNSVVVPSILDPNNDNKLLAIKHETKTGYRIAFPLSPIGENWLEKFGLLKPLELPDINNPLVKDNKKGHGGYPCSHMCAQFFRLRKLPFTPHALRHAYNHRAHNLGYNPKDIANSLGHQISTNISTYLKHESISEKVRTAKLAAENAKAKQDELTKLRLENKQLKAENERLKTLFKMHQAITDK
ncbi:hypothetical protein [Myxosarcina sp. GI1]|uniref:hypothetical protein n=1 Tax=Myxosarcina sp. GI1 TaxID=1541065 RepID=UPI00056AFB62|nr:hypothetical protein [Myxosarcina sp. GI1]